MSKTEWSIVIPALNEEENIDRCLRCLCGMRRDLSFEIVVVDNGSADRTVAIANSYAARLNLRVFVKRGVTVGGLRNYGVEKASGNYLAFLDADCLAAPVWLQRASEKFSEYPSIVAGAYYALPDDARWPAKVWHARFHAGRHGKVNYVPGGSMMMSRLTFETLGGFDDCLRSNEDSQLCSRARSLGITVVAFPELAVLHLGAEKSWLHFAKRQLWHGSNVLSRSGLRGNARAIGLALYTLCCLFGLVVCTFANRPLLLVLWIAALILPATWMGVQGSISRKGRSSPLLAGLFLTYAVVRAIVFPVAVIRAIQQLGQRRTNQALRIEAGRASRT